MAYDQGIIDEAKQKYLEGDSIAAIARDMSKEYEFALSHQTVRLWAKKEDWAAQKGDIALHVSQSLASEIEGDVLTKVEASLGRYEKLEAKSAEFLGLDDEDHPLFFDKTMDAARTMDLAIQGKRKIQSGLISVQLVVALYEILSEEIFDETVLNKISLRFKQLAAEIKQQNT